MRRFGLIVILMMFVFSIFAINIQAKELRLTELEQVKLKNVVLQASALIKLSVEVKKTSDEIQTTFRDLQKKEREIVKQIEKRLRIDDFRLYDVDDNRVLTLKPVKKIVKPLPSKSKGAVKKKSSKKNK